MALSPFGIVRDYFGIARDSLQQSHAIPTWDRNGIPNSPIAIPTWDCLRLFPTVPKRFRGMAMQSQWDCLLHNNNPS